MFDALTLQMTFYAVNVGFSAWGAWLYGRWAWKLRGQMAAMPIAILLVVAFADRIGVIANDGYWATVRGMTALGIVDFSWAQGHPAYLAKVVFSITSVTAVAGYYLTHRAAHRNRT